MFNTNFHHRSVNTPSLGGRILLATGAIFVLFAGFFIGMFALLLSLALVPVIAVRLWWLQRKTGRVTRSEYDSRADDDVIIAEYKVID